MKNYTLTNVSNKWSSSKLVKSLNIEKTYCVGNVHG